MTPSSPSQGVMESAAKAALTAILARQVIPTILVRGAATHGVLRCRTLSEGGMLTYAKAKSLARTLARLPLICLFLIIASAQAILPFRAEYSLLWLQERCPDIFQVPLSVPPCCLLFRGQITIGFFNTWSLIVRSVVRTYKRIGANKIY